MQFNKHTITEILRQGKKINERLKSRAQIKLMTVAFRSMAKDQGKYSQFDKGVLWALSWVSQIQQPDKEKLKKLECDFLKHKNEDGKTKLFK